MVSTHDIELAKSFEKELNIYHFSEQLTCGELLFNHKLLPGAEYARNAISILKRCNYPEDIVSCAESHTDKICEVMKAINID